MYERFSTAAPTTAGDSGQIIDADFIPVEEPASPTDPVSPASDPQPSALTELWQALRSRFRLDRFTVDDLLLIGIVILILRRNAEWDVLLIMAVLFFLGMFEGATT